MCGIVGVLAKQPVNQLLFDTLTLLQHRGQDAAGILTADDRGRFCLRKDNGLVRDVFRMRHMKRLQGNMGIGHVRYPTAGTSSVAEAQPFYVNSPYGIALVHNGNLTNADALKTALSTVDFRHLNTNSDSEVILNVFASALYQQRLMRQAIPEDLFKALESVYARCRGAYAVVMLIAGQGILAFRDPHGIRPLIYGRNESNEWMVASESVALTAHDYEIIGDVQPGEAIFIDNQGKLHQKQIVPCVQHTPCVFEYVYFARPDSIMDNISVYKARRNIGQHLGKQIQETWKNHDIDVVMPIPETARTAAISLATTLGLPFREGFVKNRYIGRTFIMPGQAVRRKSVKQKLTPLELEFQDKNVLLVDDSIVRGTTSREIIRLAKASGAKKVYFASAAPAIRHANIYGIDMPVQQELIAYDRDVAAIAEKIGADKLIYLSLPNLIAACQEGNPKIQKFECSVFDGDYVTGDESAYLQQVATRRQDANKTIDLSAPEHTVGLYNPDYE